MRRIWELDALRGICILGMVLMHLVFDLGALFGISQAYRHPVFLWIARYGSILFFIISGICATFSRNNVKRGNWVFAFGMLCTAVTAGIYVLGLAYRGMLIYFGVLHCLGACSWLWPAAKRLSNRSLVWGSIALIVTGYSLRFLRVSTPYLLALGLMPAGFASSDYFPLLPNLGFFLLGAVAGRTVYRSGQTRLPKINAQRLALRFLRFCGRHSLAIYLLHQPVLTGVIFLWTSIVN